MNEGQFKANIYSVEHLLHKNKPNVSFEVVNIYSSDNYKTKATVEFKTKNRIDGVELFIDLWSNPDY